MKYKHQIGLFLAHHPLFYLLLAINLLVINYYVQSKVSFSLPEEGRVVSWLPTINDGTKVTWGLLIPGAK